MENLSQAAGNVNEFYLKRFGACDILPAVELATSKGGRSDLIQDPLKGGNVRVQDRYSRSRFDGNNSLGADKYSLVSCRKLRG